MPEYNEKTTWPTWFAALMLLVGTQLAAAQELQLTPKFTPGRTAYVEETTEVWVGFDEDTPDSISTAAMLHTRLTLGALETVESVTENGVRLRRTIDRVAIVFDAPLLTPSAWDSDGVDPPTGSPSLKEALTPLFGQSYTVNLDVSYSVASVGGLDEIRALLESGMRTSPALIPVSAALSEQYIHRQWSVLASPSLLPNRHVEVGEQWTWDGVEQAGSTGDLMASYSCKLVRIDSENGRRVALVAFEGAFRPFVDSRGDSFGGPLSLSVLRGAITGRAKFDSMSGRYVRFESESQVELCGPKSADDPGESDARLRVIVRRSAFACTPGQRNRQKRNDTASP